MTISSYGIGAGAARRADEAFRGLKGSLADLQTQLISGRKAETYSGLGQGAAASLDVRARLASLETQGANVIDAELRVTLMSQGVSALEALSSGLRTSLTGSFDQTAIGQTNAQFSAEDGLRRAIDILNTDVAGRYLFSGRAADTQPVLSFTEMIDGAGGRAGLKQIVAERGEADRGLDGLGRLTLSTTGATVALAEEAAGLPFGFKLAGATATGAGLSATSSAGPPASVGLAVGAQPAVGDAVSLVLALPDGGQTTLTLTAQGAGSTPAEGGFAIGATAADTAANLAAALTTALTRAGATTLAAASGLQASRDFFAGTAANPPLRVAGPPFATATATVPGTEANTAMWYRGEAAGGSARETAAVRIGEGASVAVGARANEEPIRALLTGLGAIAAQSFAVADPHAQARYADLAARVSSGASSEGLKAIAVDLAGADVALGQAAKRIAVSRTQFEDTLAGVENADPNAVAMELLATQTRLQASYQTTAAISRLTLVDYL